MKAHT